MEEAMVDQRLLDYYPVFQKLSLPLQKRFTQELKIIKLPARYIVFEEGISCQHFPLLLSGSIRVVKPSANGRDVLLYRMLPGEWCVMSSICLFNDIQYSARGITETESEMMIATPLLFNELMGSAIFRREMFKLFGERLDELMQLLEQVLFYKLDARLATLLLGRGKVIETTHQQLADELGSAREMVSRLLKSFADRGWVRLKRESIEILNPKALRQTTHQE